MTDNEKRTPFWDASLPVEKRIDWLLKELTIDEKLGMLSSGSAPVERLGIPRMGVGSEAAHGVEARNDQNDLRIPEPTTSFPQPIGMSASWDPEAVKAAGEVTGVEARVLYHRHPDRGLVRWAPTVDMCRDPRWGRNEEGYGEDPVLTGEMASAYIQGMQGDHPHYLRIGATLKHFYANNVEDGRGWKNSTVDPRNRFEYYLEPFRRCIQKGRVEAIMTAYNRINGTVGVLNHEVRDILKDRWGLIHAVSDGGATGMVVSVHHEFGLNAQTIAAAIRAGVDAMSDNPTSMNQAAREAYELDILKEEEVDEALRNVLRTKLRLGIYDRDNANPYDKVTEADLCSDHGREVCLQLSREAVVLLKNDSKTLPLRKDADIALIGPVGDKWYQDWYGGEPDHRITLKQGIESVTGKAVPFCDSLNRVYLRSGEKYLAVRDEDMRLVLRDEPETFILTDWGEDSITLHCERLGKCLRMRVPFGQFADLSQMGQIGADRDDPFDFLEVSVFHRRDQADGTFELNTVFDTPMTLNADGTVNSRQEEETLRLTMETVRDGIAEAVALAKEHKTVVLALGCNPSVNAKESSDRETLELPPDQARLLTAVRAANPNVVLVLMTNYPYILNEADETLPAILMSATGSQDMGRALAETLYGINAPAGRVNQSWVKSMDQLPPMDDYDIIQKKRTYRYLDSEVLYPFGFGLTYTDFAYDNFSAEVRENDKLLVSFDVNNTGDTASDEVAQVYFSAPPCRVPRPLRQLIGFKRVKDVQPGECRRVELEISLDEFKYYDVISRAMLLQEGRYLIYAGRHCLDRQVSATVFIPGQQAGVRHSEARTPADHYDRSDNVEIVEGMFGFSAIQPMDASKPLRAVYQDVQLAENASEASLFIKSAKGCTVRVLVNGEEKACWQGETRTYSRSMMRFRVDPQEKLERQKPIFVDLKMPLADLPQENAPATVEIVLEGDAQLCFWRVIGATREIFG